MGSTRTARARGKGKTVRPRRIKEKQKKFRRARKLKIVPRAVVEERMNPEGGVLIARTRWPGNMVNKDEPRPAQTKGDPIQTINKTKTEKNRHGGLTT